MEGKHRSNFSQFFRMLALHGRMDAAWFFRDTKLCLLAIASDFVSNLSVYFLGKMPYTFHYTNTFQEG